MCLEGPSTSTTALKATDVALSNQPTMWGSTLAPKATFLTPGLERRRDLEITQALAHTLLASQGMDCDKLARK